MLTAYSTCTFLSNATIPLGLPPIVNNNRLMLCAYNWLRKKAHKQYSLSKHVMSWNDTSMVAMTQFLVLTRSAEVKKRLSEVEMKGKRMLEVFSNTSKEFRQVVYRMTGYRIDIPQNHQYKLMNMYANSPDDFLLFNVSLTACCWWCHVLYELCMSPLVTCQSNQAAGSCLMSSPG